MSTFLARAQWIPGLLLAAALFASQVAINHRLRVFESYVPPRPDQQVQRWNPDLFKALTFGHWPASVDWLWMRSIQDPSVAHVAKGTHAPPYYDLDLATDLDPAFFEAYVAGANLLAVIRGDAGGARDLLLKGEKFRTEKLPARSDEFQSEYWGSPWQIPLLLAYCSLFEFNDMPSAAQWFSAAAAVPGSPAYLQDLDRRLKRPGGQYEVGIRLLTFMASGARDPQLASELGRKRDSLVVTQFLDGLRRLVAQFRAEHPRASVRQAWAELLREGRARELDPWGGQLSIDDAGKVETTTPHERVFGLN